VVVQRRIFNQLEPQPINVIFERLVIVAHNQSYQGDVLKHGSFVSPI
jgi:hypothetical protein